jgi:superfamily II DNA or RNA helicase
MYSKIAIGTHLFVPKEEMRLSVAEAREKFTVKSSFNGDDEFAMYLDLPKSFGVPLYYYKNWHKIAEKVVDLRNEGSKIRFKFKSKLRPGQGEVIKKFMLEVKRKRTGFTLEAPPGFGKTVVLIKMLEILQRSAIIIVPRSNLVSQWVDRISEHSTYPKRRIGVINGKDVRCENCPIVVALVHSVAARMSEANTAFFNMFGVAVFDEVDRSVPPATFSPVLGLFPVKYRIGASATVRRTDGLHVIHDNHISQVRLKGKDVGRMAPKILVVKYSGDSGTVWPGSKKLNRRGMLLSMLANNSLRNHLICKYIRLIYNSGRRVLVLSDRTNQLYKLNWMMNRRAYGGIKIPEMGYYCDSVDTGEKKFKVSKEALEVSAINCKIIFGTYGKVGIGTDIPDLAGLVYATPQSQVEQTQGRIERMLEGKSQPVVVDIVDTRYRDAERWWRTRMQYYRRKQLKIKVVS